MYTPPQLANTTPGAAVTISGGALNGPMGLAFDNAGNLWVANNTGNTLVKYAANQLTASGSPTPAVVVSGPALSGPAGLAFDIMYLGGLWVTNMAANTVVEYTPSQLRKLTPHAAATITSNAGSLSSPRAIAFSWEGLMSVANFTGNTIQEYGDYESGGSMTPHNTIHIAAPDAGPIAMAFDNFFSLYVLTATGSHVIRY